MTPEIAQRFAEIALGHVTREYPHKLDHVMAGPQDVLEPHQLHPIFYGSFDWHSCVHGWWLLMRLRRLFPDMPAASTIDALAAEMLTEEKVAGELAYLDRPTSAGFERPYGWAWMLALHREVAVMEPLAGAFADRFRTYLPKLTYPIRTGTHFNTAFALVLALEWAEENDESLADLIRERAFHYYGEDRNCRAWEPGGDDFLSPALVEALLMRRVLGEKEFRDWFARFLPEASASEPRSLFTPAFVSDRSDGKIAHLDGFNLSRAWCWRGIAEAFDPPLKKLALRTAELHLGKSLPHVAGDYMGEHWLATFALLALTGGASGKAATSYKRTPTAAPVESLKTLQTPCLLLDEVRLRTNIEKMREHLGGLGVAFRPHLKTAKSLDVARLAMETPEGPAMVSTLREAEYFAEGGVRDMIYGVGIAPAKLPRVSAIRAQGVDLAVILDSVEQAQAVAMHSRSSGDAVPVLIEVDADGRRAGVAADDAETLVAIGRRVTAGGAVLRGVLVHAGGSYAFDDSEALAAAAEVERLAAVRAAGALRAAGMPCPVVSVGSTPTARFARDLSGVTEMRPGVFMFGDLYQSGVGSVAIEDIAVSVLATVIGHQRAKGWVIIDAGWMALSRDRSTASQAVDQGYGVVCDPSGQPYRDLIVTDAHQEHGIVALRRGSEAALPDLPIGSRVRILPNHACATAAQHDRYLVLDGAGRVTATWPRINGW